MVETKPWYLSRTIWASVVTVAAAVGSLFGLPVGRSGNAIAGHHRHIGAVCNLWTAGCGFTHSLKGGPTCVTRAWDFVFWPGP